MVKKSGLNIWSSQFKDEAPLWFWHVKSRNGKIVADGSEGYTSEAKARQGFKAAARAIAKELVKLEKK